MSATGALVFPFRTDHQLVKRNLVSVCVCDIDQLLLWPSLIESLAIGEHQGGHACRGDRTQPIGSIHHSCANLFRAVRMQGTIAFHRPLWFIIIRWIRRSDL